MKKLLNIGMTMVSMAVLAGCGEAPAVTPDYPTIRIVRTTSAALEPVYPGANHLYLRSNSSGIVVATLLETNSVLSFDGLTQRPAARNINPGADAEIPLYVSIDGCAPHAERIRLDLIGDGGQNVSAIETIQVNCE